jgi:hypothetical protein
MINVCSRVMLSMDGYHFPCFLSIVCTSSLCQLIIRVYSLILVEPIFQLLTFNFLRLVLFSLNFPHPPSLNFISHSYVLYESVSKSFRTGRLERELQMVQLSAMYRYFVSQSSEFCRHNPLCCFSTSGYCCRGIFRY